MRVSVCAIRLECIMDLLLFPLLLLLLVQFSHLVSESGLASGGQQFRCLEGPWAA